MISEEEIQAFYGEFLEALKSGDTALLERIYADNYMLMRPNGDNLSKVEILADLRHHSIHFLLLLHLSLSLAAALANCNTK